MLGHASAVFHHGGFGTTTGTISSGLPQLVAPIFTRDQAVNGRHVAAAQAGRTVDPGPDVITRALTALHEVLEDPTYATGATATAHQARDLPDMATAITHLEALS